LAAKRIRIRIRKCALNSVHSNAQLHASFTTLGKFVGRNALLTVNYSIVVVRIARYFLFHDMFKLYRSP
jgi:hypothetical protein